MSELYHLLKSDPFSILGMQTQDNNIVFRTYHPKATQVELINKITSESTPLQADDHFFSLKLQETFPYKVRFTCNEHSWEEEDIYSFPPLISDYDLHLFSEGTHRRTWDFLGAHEIICNGVEGVMFAVWAPNAKSVRVVGDFNSWDKDRYYMRLRGSTGVWEIFIPYAHEGSCYKYLIETQGGELLEKSDPYAFHAEKRPNTASKVYNLTGFQWNDEAWMKNRTKNFDKPMSVYECHLGTWLRDQNNEFLSYADLAKPLAEYLNENAFTHVELMPITEFPFDGSWGYQVTGYFAPTSRYGTPDEFMYFVDFLHQHGIGVIIDWVPAHFPYDAHGLARFDGTALYEHEDPRLGWHNDWNTHIFNYARTEVREFLVSNALFWLEMYHIDGLRVDAVASMLYLDYSREEGEWIPNKYGGRENLEAIEFIQSLNAEVERYFPTAITIAEESTSFPKVTHPTSEGGLGFTYKWNMGWMNDTLSYFSVDPLFRSWHHNELTFSLMYAFTERFILPFSHDEVVHGKNTLLNQMAGDVWERFANLRLMYAYMWLHPGKKLLFAGQEWAPWDEWGEEKPIDWGLNHLVEHEGVRKLVHDLNHCYRYEPALHQMDHHWDGFSWVDCDNRESGLLIWVRQNGTQKFLTVLNLNPVAKENYRIGVPFQAVYKEMINTDSPRYGGAGFGTGERWTDPVPYQGENQSISITIGPLSALVFRIE